MADVVTDVDAFWVTDIDSDGRSDLLVAYPFPRDELVAYRNDPNIGFTSPQAIDVDVSWFFYEEESIVIADIDSDGDEDFVFLNRSRGISIASNSGGTYEVLALPPIDARSIDALNVADYDGDGDLDIMALDERSVVVIENNLASGVFLPKPSQRAFGNLPGVVGEVGSTDLDGDGKAELIAGFTDGQTRAYQIGDDYLLTQNEVANVYFS